MPMWQCVCNAPSNLNMELVKKTIISQLKANDCKDVSCDQGIMVIANISKLVPNNLFDGVTRFQELLNQTFDNIYNNLDHYILV